MTKGIKCLIITGAIVAVAAIAFGAWIYNAAYTVYEGPDEVTLVIPRGSTSAAVDDSLSTRLGDYGVTVARLWSLRNGDPLKAAGVYTVTPGDKAWSVASRIKAGRSSAVKVTFNNIRLMDDLAQRVAASFPWSAGDFLTACDSVLPRYNFTKEQYPAAFIPDTYEFYASADPAQVVTKLLEHRNDFWNQERRAQARSLGLTPVEVATIASIVEEESSNRAEHGDIARLYMNRYNKGMKLQADPTVKYALGDFSLRRIYNVHTAHPSQYNTYYTKGLPPGPIRIPEKATLEEVLNAPENNYLYMCARPGGEHRHNFTDSYNVHLSNARAYQNWLDSINIH